MKNEGTKRSGVFQDGLFDPSRVVERALENGTVIRLRLEPLDNEKVRVLEYSRQHKTAAWQRCPQEEGRVLDYTKLGLAHSYSELFASLTPSP